MGSNSEFCPCCTLIFFDPDTSLSDIYYTQRLPVQFQLDSEKEISIANNQKLEGICQFDSRNGGSDLEFIFDAIDRSNIELRIRVSRKDYYAPWGLEVDLLVVNPLRYLPH